LLNLEDLKKIDSQNMFKTYDKWPEIANEQFNTDFDVLDNNFEHIVFAGMGGSGTIGDLFSSILSKTNIHVDVVKGYLLPKTVDSDSLVAVTSISGNTVESLTVLESAQKIGCKTIAFSNGGKIQDYCKKNKIEFRKIPSYHSPRASFSSFLYSMLNILKPILPIKELDVIESISKMKELRNNIFSENISENNQALQIANWLPDIPVIYYPLGLESAAIRFKNSLQENAKMHVITEDVIEACHNGIVSWSKPSTVIKPIMIRGIDDYVKTQERWVILKDYFKNMGIDYKEIFSYSGSILTKIINLIYLLDYSTIYKAVSLEIDPTPVKAINYVKERSG
jgi:glucose/mannose-6-phosphate isomerase